MKLGTFLLDEKGQKSFYFELLIPKIREDKAFEITSWKKVNQEFEYKNPTFAEGEDRPNALCKKLFCRTLQGIGY